MHSETHISDVPCLAAEFRIDEARERRRKLIVNEELHADRRTG